MRHWQTPRKPKARIEIIPMIDVMMFLLVFFVLISINVIPALGVKTMLPTSEQAQDIKSVVNALVTLGKNDELQLNGKCDRARSARAVDPRAGATRQQGRGDRQQRQGRRGPAADRRDGRAEGQRLRIVLDRVEEEVLSPPGRWLSSTGTGTFRPALLRARSSRSRSTRRPIGRRRSSERIRRSRSRSRWSSRRRRRRRFLRRRPTPPPPSPTPPRPTPPTPDAAANRSRRSRRRCRARIRFRSRRQEPPPPPPAAPTAAAAHRRRHRPRRRHRRRAPTADASATYTGRVRAYLNTRQALPDGSRGEHPATRRQGAHLVRPAARRLAGRRGHRGFVELDPARQRRPRDRPARIDAAVRGARSATKKRIASRSTSISSPS